MLGLKRRRLAVSMKFELRKTARGLSDDELLEDLQRVARKLGRDTVTISEYTEHRLGHATTIQRRFRSWFKALADAGLKASRSRIGISDEELFENLRAVWTSLGRQPSYGEIKTPLSQYSAGTYEKRFGRWSQALQQFVEWVNSDEGARPDEPRAETETPRNAREQVRLRTVARNCTWTTSFLGQRVVRPCRTTWPPSAPDAIWGKVTHLRPNAQHAADGATRRR